MPTFQAMEFLERVLDALAGQDLELPWDVLAVDSGSTDGTLECLRRHGETFPVPLCVRTIAPAAFDHGDTRNVLAARTSADLLVFLTQDAIPSNPRWLTLLVRNFEDAGVGAAYCRNVPRDDCWPLTRAACADDPGYAPRRAVVRLPPRKVYERMDATQRRVLYNFNDVASAVRRELWERHPFPRTMMGEDVLMGRGILEAGYALVYDAAATVQHSHDYEVKKLRWRGEVDAKFNAEWLDRVLVEREEHIPILARRLADGDLARLARRERAGQAARALELRTALVEGMYEGSRAKRRYPSSAMRADGRVRVLFIVSGPEAHAHGGRLARALALGEALLERGHACSVCLLGLESALPAVDAADTGARDWLGALYVERLRVADDARGEAAVRALLEAQRPDVVHVLGTDRAAALAVAAVWCANKPVALHLDRLEPGNSDLQRLGLSAAAADLCLVPSAEMLRRVRAEPRFARLELSRIVPVVEGADADRLRARPKSRASVVRLGVFAADLVSAREQGLTTILTAFGALEAGTAQLRVHLASACSSDAEAPLASGIHWVRGFAPAELSELFAEVDLMVALPGCDAGAGSFVAQSLLLETPVLAVRGRGADELVVDGSNGVVLPASDAATLATALTRLVSERSLLERLRPQRAAAPTFDEEVAEFEFRCRSMACLGRERVLPSRMGFELAGSRLGDSAGGAPREHAAPEGTQERRVRIALEGLPDGPFEIEIDRPVHETAAPRGAAALSGAAALVDGAALTACGPPRVCGAGPASRLARWRKRLRASVRGGAAPKPRPIERTVLRGFAWRAPRELFIGGASERAPDILSVRWRSHAVIEAGPPTREERSRRQLEIAESLRVSPGPPVSEDRLPRLAVVIPTFNGREVLEPCLESLSAADYPAQQIEWIVVDNGSTDGTADLLRARFPKARLIALERNEGFARACNLGARGATQADVLVFLNNDMRVDARFLVELVSPLARRECRATVAKRLSWDGTTLDGAGVGSNFAGIALQPGYGLPPGAEHDVPRKTLFPCGGAMAVDRPTFEEVGGFDGEFFAYYEDLDLGWRMWLMGHATHYVPSAVAYHHHSHTSRRFPPASLRRAMIRNSLLTCIKNYEDGNLERVLPVVLALASRRAWLASGLDSAQHRIEDAAGAELARSGARAGAGRPTSIRSLGAGDWAAIDDLLGNFAFWMERRRAVQAHRVVPDREIFPMFLDPLSCVEEDPAYRALQERLSNLYRVRELFEPE